jgi:hypothetical protein
MMKRFALLLAALFVASMVLIAPVWNYLGFVDG